ncbi:MAG: hypothetical protein WCQ95_03610 [Bacteroidota bacterium]
MNKLSTYTKNPFITISTSKLSMQKFVYDHIQRMIAVNNPLFAAIIAATTTCWQNIFGNLATYDGNLNLQKGFTQQVVAKMQEFVDKALDLEATVISKFKKDTPKYKEFYPHYRTEYHNATQENILILMERMVNASHKYKNDIGLT